VQYRKDVDKLLTNPITRETLPLFIFQIPVQDFHHLVKNMVSDNLLVHSSLLRRRIQGY
jgi:hypothetical protein